MTERIYKRLVSAQSLQGFSEGTLNNRVYWRPTQEIADDHLGDNLTTFWDKLLKAAHSNHQGKAFMFQQKTAEFGFTRLVNKNIKVLLDHVKSKEIAPRDAMVLMAIVAFCDWKTGRTNVTVKRLSETLETAAPNIRASIRRLRACRLLVSTTNNEGIQVFIPHPNIFQCGSGKSRGLTLKLYYQEIYGKDFRSKALDVELEEYLEKPGRSSLEAEIHSDLDFED